MKPKAAWKKACHEEAENPPGADTILFSKKVGWVFRGPEPSWVDPQDQEEGSTKGRVASCIEMLVAAKKLPFFKKWQRFGFLFFLLVVVGNPISQGARS